LERQRAALANALPGARVYVDELDPRDRQGHSVAALGQRKVLLRTTSRPAPLTITVAALSVLGWAEDDMRALLSALVARNAVLVSLEDGIVYGEGGDADRVIEAWKEAKTKSRLEGAARRGGMVTKERIEAATAAKIEPHKHLWGDPRYLSTDVLKLMGVTRNTVNKHMGMTWEQAVRKNRERFHRQERKAAKEKKDE
jgi:hypothetical protein